jgi:hypothetical protein
MMPSRLAEKGAQVDAARHRVAHQRAQVDAGEAHLRVHEGEQRQDDEVHGDGDRVLHALERRGHVVHDTLDARGGGGEVVLAQDVLPSS